VRRTLSCLAALTLAAAGASVAFAPAADAASPAGSYVALSKQARVVDTRTGAGGNHKGAVRGGHGITVTIAGRGTVPKTGVGSVLVTITAVSPTASGGIVGYVGSRPATTNVQFAKGHTVSDSAVLQLSSGKVNLFNTASSGSVQIVVDVSGYYPSGTASGSDPGIFHAVHPARVVNTVTGGAFGNRNGALGAGRSFSPSLHHAGISANAGAVAVTITALNVKKAGAIVARRPDEPSNGLALLHFTPGRRASAFAILRVSDVKATLTNTSAGSVDLYVDVLGYYNIGFAVSAHAFQTLLPTRVASPTLAAGGTTQVTLAGRGGVPISGVSAALVTLHVVSPARSGRLQAWRPGTTRPKSASVLQFEAGRTTSGVVLVPLASGQFDLHSTSTAKLHVVVDVHGFVPSSAMSLPTTKATARYLRATDSTTMTAAGTADAGNTFVLIHVGAQLNDKSGVQVSKTGVNVLYGDLVTALNTYLAAFVAHGGSGTVAIATNNDAQDWTAYPATQRGQDWADKVVDAIAPHAGVSIAGADDIEGQFFSTEPQAEQWETAFLGATSADLIFNGSADGCPITWTTGGTCDFGWTQAQYYRLATGVEHASRTYALPQVFRGALATQWAMIDKTGGRGIRFLGSLTQHALASSTLTATQGWAALRRAVSSVTSTSIGSNHADIH
jgi:hypothetical protein